MGLFSRKKKIEVPVSPSDDLLKFPQAAEAEQGIIPEKIKRVVGLEDEQSESIEEPQVPEKVTRYLDLEKQEEAEQSFPESPSEQRQSAEREEIVIQKPFFIRMQDYIELTQGLDVVKSNVLNVGKINEHLDKSEFNENKDYERLKRDLKKIHDRLLFMDDLIFKR